MSRFVFRCPLRWSDMDAYGHVNNVVYLRYLEEARVAMFFEGARTAGVSTFEGELVVVRHEIDYRRPLVFGPEPIVVETWVTDIRNSSCSLRYEVRNDDLVYAEARSVLAAYDAKAGHARRLTDPERAWLEKFRDDAAPTG
ncbi:acyl-CoA thioesterase [Actinopolymorpha singaporensis]|uniref:Acyl-CoA thioester hydrolase n=1 Tax=Actinopolymorpha singaporensis TaxID=117157 RepID=A0A1H1U7K8_9ACTN|nr:thioesterase family protein [Actinopolymorpha singaporensis]SDS68470.1 acyl-CoA thioester hydrolase [Actinopolymorpha singaporensis]